MNASQGLARALGRWQLLAVTVGAVVGAAIYIRPAMIAQELRDPSTIVLVWIVAGALSLAGALSYGQLALRWPHAGGEYVYLRATMGEPAAFLFGWMRLTVGAAVAAAQATAVVVFMSDLVPIAGTWVHWSPHVLGRVRYVSIGPRQMLAIGMIWSLAYLNCRGVGQAGRFQTAVTILKVASLITILVAIFALGNELAAPAHSIAPDPPAALGWGAALLGAITAFNGWTNAAMLAGETKDPERVVPWALSCGMAIAVVLYLAANIGFLMVLPVSEIASGNSPLHPHAPSAASLAVSAAVGHQASAVLSAVLAVSALGALHVGLLASPRVFFAMARDGLLPGTFGRTNPSTHAPTASIVGYASIASVLAIVGSYDLLSNMAGLGFLIFYVVTVLGLLRVLGRERADGSATRGGFLVWAIPISFLGGTAALLAMLVTRGTTETVSALALMGAGIPVYLLARSRRQRRSARNDLA